MTEIEEVCVSVAELKVGMFVCRLDRPWIETPFAMAGFEISSEAEIGQLRQHCKKVFIDVAKGVRVDPFAIDPGALPVMAVDGEDEARPERPKPLSRLEQKAKYEALRRQEYEQQTTLKQEMTSAKPVFDGMQKEVAHILSALEEGHLLECEALRAHVHETVASLIRNPSAMMLLVQLEKSDKYNYNHALGTSVWCAEFGRHLGLERDQIDELALGGMLLDVGKTKLPSDLFEKQEFSEADRRQVQLHVERSMEILRETDGISPAILEMVETHHERFDGSGYPRRLCGDQIPLFGRIAGIVDSYDAMTTLRPYTNKVLSPHQAISQMYHWRDSLFEAELVEQFIQTVGIYPAGSLVELDTGQVGLVVSINNVRKLSPTVLLVLDENKNPLPIPKQVNLAQGGVGARVSKGLSPGAYGVTFEELEVQAIPAF